MENKHSYIWPIGDLFESSMFPLYIDDEEERNDFRWWRYDFAELMHRIEKEPKIVWKEMSGDDYDDSLTTKEYFELIYAYINWVTEFQDYKTRLNKFIQKSPPIN